MAACRVLGALLAAGAAEEVGHFGTARRRASKSARRSKNSARRAAQSGASWRSVAEVVAVVINPLLFLSAVLFQ